MTITQAQTQSQSTVLLSVEGLEVSYQTRRGRVEAIRGVDLELHRGEVVAVVGESGSGKSTLAQTLIGLLPANGDVSRGRVNFDGVDLAALGDTQFQKLRGSRIGLIPQDPTVSLNPVRRIGDQIAEGLVVHRIADKQRAREIAVDVLAQAGIDDPRLRSRQYPHELSGGMRQRVLIGMALACQPELLIADEPTSALDVTVQRSILDHLEQRIADTGVTVLFITHDLAVAADRAQRIVVMSEGRVVESGTVDEVLGRPTHPYTITLLSAAPSLASTSMVRSASNAPRPVPPADTSPTDRDITDTAGNTAMGNIVEVRHLFKTFSVKAGDGHRREVAAVRDVSFDIPRATTFSLVGESGSGKSTTARMVLRLAEPSSGSVRINGVDITTLDRRRLRELRRTVQVVYQNPYTSLSPRFTVGQVVEEPLRAFGVGNRAERRARVTDLLDQVALPQMLRTRRPSELSGGQRQRVAIARALALDPELVVLDEPVSALDVSVQDQVLRLLADLQERLAVSYLFISHDLAVVKQISHTVGVMCRGELVETGSVDTILTTPQHPYTHELLAAIPGGEFAAPPVVENAILG